MTSRYHVNWTYNNVVVDPRGLMRLNILICFMSIEGVAIKFMNKFVTKTKSMII